MMVVLSDEDNLKIIKVLPHTQHIFYTRETPGLFINNIDYYHSKKKCHVAYHVEEGTYKLLYHNYTEDYVYFNTGEVLGTWSNQ